MSENTPTYGLQQPPDTVRCFIPTTRLVVVYFCAGVLSAAFLFMMVWLALTLRLPVSLLGCAAMPMSMWVLYTETLDVYRWVELEGNTLRARRLYFWRTIVRSVNEIESLSMMTRKGRRDQTEVLKRKVDSVAGVEIRFRDRRTPVRIDSMINAKELIEAVLYRMTQMGELEAETFPVSRRFLVGNIHWKGEKPYLPSGQRLLKLSLFLLTQSAFISGFGLADWAGKEQKRHLLGSVPSHEMTLQSLIQDGPGANRHVTLSGFRRGGYAYASSSGTWKLVWIALFPAGTPAENSNEIQVVLSSYYIGDEAALQQLLQPGCVTGICSERPSLNWETPLGTELVKANQGSHPSSAWIIEEMREPPSAALVTELLTSSAGCFAAVIILATLVFFWKAA